MTSLGGAIGLTRAGDAAAKRSSALLLLAGLLVVAIIGSSLVGSVAISPSDLVDVALRMAGAAPRSATADHHADVLLAIRLPRVLLGVLVGAGLGASGATMQGLFRNPLVDPGLLGISTGASLGAVASIVVGERFARGLPPAAAPYVLPIAAFVGAVAATVAVTRIARVGGRTMTATLLLAGIAVNALASAFTGLLIFVSDDAQLRSITFWSLGSLGAATPRGVLATAIFLGVPLLVMLRHGRALDALLLGEAEAGHVGVDVPRTRRVLVTLVAIVVGSSVAIAGVLGFVGLVVPHVLRLALGPGHRALLPGSALFGGALLLGADAVARTIASPAEVPLGIVTASIGAPVFLALLLRERRRLA